MRAGRARASPSNGPFTALGLAPRPDLTDDDVRSAWRRIAAATHPDREDGGDPPRFAESAAAYMTLRTRYGRGEALADLADDRHARLSVLPRWPPRARRESGSQPRAGPPGQRRPAFAPRLPIISSASRRLPPCELWLAFARLPSRVWRGRPGRLALRVAAVAAVSAGSVLVAGDRPATPALVTGALTWLALTSRHEVAPPRAGSKDPSVPTSWRGSKLSQ